jgi:hypothetical protein
MKMGERGLSRNKRVFKWSLKMSAIKEVSKRLWGDSFWRRRGPTTYPAPPDRTQPMGRLVRALDRGELVGSRAGRACTNRLVVAGQLRQRL